MISHSRSSSAITLSHSHSLYDCIIQWNRTNTYRGDINDFTALKLSRAGRPIFRPKTRHSRIGFLFQIAAQGIAMRDTSATLLRPKSHKWPAAKAIFLVSAAIYR
jgi:hypothetical protein